MCKTCHSVAFKWIQLWLLFMLYWNWSAHQSASAWVRRCSFKLGHTWWEWFKGELSQCCKLGSNLNKAAINFGLLLLCFFKTYLDFAFCHVQDLSEIWNASKIMAFVHVVQKLFWTIPMLISTRFYMTMTLLQGHGWGMTWFYFIRKFSSSLI